VNTNEQDFWIARALLVPFDGNRHGRDTRPDQDGLAREDKAREKGREAQSESHEGPREDVIFSVIFFDMGG
jgi:hypothetical protein